VDDDEKLLEVTQRYLNRAEPTLTLITSSSAQEALQILQKNQFDVVVSDYQMPDMDGLELLQKLRGEGNDIPFVMFTGKGREEVAMQALNLGANYYLMKGAEAISTFGELAHIIRQLAHHQQIEKALRETEELSNHIIESMTDGILALDQDFHYTLWNKAMEKISHIPREELIGTSRRPWEVFPHLVEQGVDQMMKRAMEGEVVHREDIPYRLADGTTGFTTETYSPLRSEIGEIRGIIGLIRDITQRRLTELQLQYQGELFNEVSDAIITSDENYIITSWNRAAEEMYGWKAAEAIGTPVGEILQSRFLEKNTEEVVKEFESSRSWQGEVMQKRKDGKSLYVLSSVTQAKGSVEDQIIVIAINRNITDRKRAEQAFQDSQRELTIRNRISDAFLTISDNTVYKKVLEIILSAMQSKYGVFGYIDDAGNLVQASLTEDIWDQCAVPEKTILFPPPTWRGIFRRCLKEGEAAFSNEPFEVPTGHIPIKRALGVPIIHHGSIIGLLIVANKSTDYVETDQETLKALTNYVAPTLQARLQKDEQRHKRKRAEKALHINYRLLEIANRHTEMKPLLDEFVAEIQNYTGCTATGLRFLDEEGNIPYEAHQGFSQSFYESESPLSIRSDHCMCINVIRGNYDPKLPFFTEYGSFYMNGTTRFLATVSEEEKGQTRNVCNMVGFESVALVPIRLGDRILGLIHLADYQENKVPLEIVQIIERVALQVATALQRVLAEEELKRQKEELSEFAHAMAHDLKNPLFAIEGLADLQHEESDPGDMERVGNLARQAQALLQRSVELADAGQVIKKTDRSDLTELASTAAQVAIPENIAFETDQLPTVLCDPLKVKQIFKNLFENAAVHGNPQKIEVQKQIMEDRTEILISNDGSPISPENRSQIFQLGFTGDQNGSGLGLTIVQKIVSAHGWQISLADTPKTTFVIQIPAVS
jgi:PAS domain S-box-containing protein